MLYANASPDETWLRGRAWDFCGAIIVRIHTRLASWPFCGRRQRFILDGSNDACRSAMQGKSGLQKLLLDTYVCEAR